MHLIAEDLIRKHLVNDIKPVSGSYTNKELHKMCEQDENKLFTVTEIEKSVKHKRNNSKLLEFGMKRDEIALDV